MLNDQKLHIIEVIKTSLRNKFATYRPETTEMPFHFRLLGKDRMALYSFIQSLNTTFGTSIYEPVAVSLAKSKFRKVEAQYTLGDTISEEAQKVIQGIMNKLTIGHDVNKDKEIELIRRVCQTGKMNKLKSAKVDVYVESEEGEVFLFDLKTVKPNTGDFKYFKRTLLEWAAIWLRTNSEGRVNTILAIPYNPYEPEPYERWTLKGMLDLEHELKVAEEFWDFLGGEGAYQELLDCFERVGIALRDEVDEYFSRFK
ncbi:MAG: TdeIII family type II restriction endonuclease [Ignavibacteriae bacterium]|nr:TdeIII family type II restriction endonuclease [Ignavibacteriota bacterium]